jgi:cell wall-associated NlpC family hydrolase
MPDYMNTSMLADCTSGEVVPRAALEMRCSTGVKTVLTTLRRQSSHEVVKSRTRSSSLHFQGKASLGMLADVAVGVSDSLGAFRQELVTLGTQYRLRYGTPIFSIKTRRDSLVGNDLVISGRVLLDTQRSAITRIGRRIAGQHQFEITVASEPPRDVPAGVADDDVVDLYESALPNARLATQVTAEDPAFAILEERHGRLLVRLDDGTLGWVDEKRVATSRTPFRERRIAERCVAGGDPRDVVDEALSYLGVPYVTGARTRKAIDCSALIQRVFRATCGVVLPRNTRCQSRCGLAIPLPRARAGDVVFLGGPLGLHVGLMLDHERVVHASYRKHRIAVDTLADLRQSLALIGVRRLV